MTEAPATETAPDPIRELEQLRAANRRWRRTALGAIIAFVFLFVVSLVQFLGAFITCRLLHETRQEAARNRQETMKALGEIKEARDDLQKTRISVENGLARMKAKAEAELKKIAPRLAAVRAELEKIDKVLDQAPRDAEPRLTLHMRVAELKRQESKLNNEINKYEQVIAEIDNCQRAGSGIADCGIPPPK